LGKALGKMTSEANPAWVLPASIPFPNLKGHDLEECVYWLFDALGARDLEWRTGSTGEGTADGGRDLEATFYVSSPDGEMEEERWWIECKGRSGTLNSGEVKKTIINASALESVACVVIVTNTTFSNPTRDWVNQWHISHKSPRIKLWDHSSLERQLSRHPDVVLRLFSEALSTAGRLEALRERFWNKLEYTPVKALKEIWSEKGNLQIGPMERMSLIANEFAHGNIERRPWAGSAEPQEVFETFQIGLMNLRYFWARTIRIGVDETPIIRSLAYLVVAILQFLDAEYVARAILKMVTEKDGEKLPVDVVELILMPVLDQISSEMATVCSADCHRFFAHEKAISRGRESSHENEESIDTYWWRLSNEGLPGKEEPERYVRIEKTNAPCKVGFELDGERSCPLYQVEPAVDNVVEFLSVIERVSEFRIMQARSAL